MRPEDPITVAIDGPAGAGKSSVATEVARALGFRLVDTGAIYRSVAYLAGQRGLALNDDDGLAQLVVDLPVRFELEGLRNRIFLGDAEVTEAIRTPEISLAASAVSARPVVRAGLLALQRRLAGEGHAVLEGRDIGTVVFPHAAVKVFLDAAPEERARRRLAELLARGERTDFATVLAAVLHRDAQDTGRDIAPLRPAHDAILLDSTSLSLDEVVQRVVNAVAAYRSRSSR